MSKASTLPQAEVELLDQFYREGGLRAMASPHVHYDDPACPHPGCDHRMEWIDFKLELHNDPEGVYKPLVRSWWEEPGSSAVVPACGGWVAIHDTSEWLPSMTMRSKRLRNCRRTGRTSPSSLEKRAPSDAENDHGHRRESNPGAIRRTGLLPRNSSSDAPEGLPSQLWRLVTSALVSFFVLFVLCPDRARYQLPGRSSVRRSRETSSSLLKANSAIPGSLSRSS